jgi:hypothetical protein
MKTLLAKFRISNADLNKRLAAVDDALRCPPAKPPFDAGLHQSIMRAVRANANVKDVAPSPKLWFVMGATAIAALCILLIVRSSPPAATLSSPSYDPRTLAEAQGVFDMGAQVSRSMPAAVVAPLSNELASVDHDIRNTTQFLLASLP